MNKKIRFAVIGCGHIGKRHAEMITRDEGAELVALCDIRPKEELGIEAYAVPFARNIDELFRLGLDIDVVNICTPNGLHAEMAIQARSDIQIPGNPASTPHHLLLLQRQWIINHRRNTSFFNAACT